MAGKPYSPIYDLCVAEAERLLGRAVDHRRILCVGDGIPTDVRGAADQGLDCLFIASGIHGAETLGADGRVDPGLIAALLAREGAHAPLATGMLTW